ncbi:MAG TPA: hypothetical protein VK766_01870 [Cytophagaceae bacterium]|jgi:hypothetical protein|nr:hypothetical protein [Cytophagaceae bacterium]
MSGFLDSSLGKKAISLGKNKLGIDFGDFAKLKIGSYTSFLNPSEISHTYSVVYVDPEKAINPGTNTNEYNGKRASSGPETLSFELLLDGTGVTGSIIDVAWEVKDLSNAVYQEPTKDNQKQNGIVISWGKTINFTGSLINFSVSYSLFDSQGNPLRAKIQLSFVGNSDLTKVSKVDRKTNTQIVDINEDSNLSVVCKSIYNNPVAYVAVAKANKLTNIRKLKSGTKLTLPPIKA